MTKSSGETIYKILYVDDEPELLASVVDVLAPLGFEVLTAANVDLAMQMIRDEADALVLVVSDYSMPEKSGFDLRKEMLTEHRHIPFVLVSGYIGREEALNAIDLKISAFVEKPFVVDHFRQVIEAESLDRLTTLKDEAELITGFAAEAEAMLEEMESLILDLEDNPENVESINRIFACAHTIKGTAGYFKPDTVHKFTHRYEDYLSRFKKNPSLLEPTSIGVLLKGVDTIKKLVAELLSRARSTHSLDDLLLIFEQAPPTAAPSKALATANPTTKSPPPAQIEELKVGIPLLNQFMEKSGELTVLRNMVNKVVRFIELEHPGDPNVSLLSDLLGEMHKVNGFMQDKVVDLRKVPLRHVFKPLSRTVRDLSVNLKKKIDMKIDGEDLRIDHRLADVLSKCLIHMIRNSADHGIESAEERARCGKEGGGLIQIQAREAQDEVIISLRDDGRGIDAARIKAKVAEKGLRTPEDLDRMNESELRMLIFEPGFSTAEQVTDVSGRGVGTDMVRGSVLSIGGRIELKSEVGKGTEFIFKLPIPKSVLIVSSLLIRERDRVFALPRDQIARVIRVDSQTKQFYLRRVGRSEVFQSDDHLIPVLHLGEILQLPPARPATAEREAGVLMLINCNQGTYCLWVDTVLDTEDSVVKRAGGWMQNIPFYTGATFLADGSIGLILNTEGLASNLAVKPPARTEDEASQKKSLDSVLLFQLSGTSLYGVPQSEIFRLEEFKQTDLRTSGDQTVVIYRDQVMPLFDLESLVREKSGPGKGPLQKDSSQHPFQAIVIEKERRFFAFVIGSFYDFAESALQTEFLEGAKSEVHVIANKSVTMIHIHDYLPETTPPQPAERAA